MTEFSVWSCIITAAEEIAHQGLYQKWHGHRELRLVCAGKQWMNFTPINADKGIALSEYQNMHGISPQETMPSAII